MLRRRHKKSRGGCLECRRRHVKCDEGRPICRLCVMSERVCSYASKIPPKLPEPRLDMSSLSPRMSHSPGVVISTPATTTASQSDQSSPHQLSNHNINPRQDGEFSPVNLTHMELFIHLVTDNDILKLGHVILDASFDTSALQQGLNVALTYPYLLHQMLALSARHLAYLHPSKSQLYTHEAVTLQTQAISLFNASWAQTAEIDQSNCVAILLFSSTLGHHVLADTLAFRDPNSDSRIALISFMTYYIQCVEAHRGIHTVATTAWPQLMDTWLEPILSWSSGFNSRPTKGTHCAPLKELFANPSLTSYLSDAEREVCLQAIEYLQIGFDAILATDEEDNGVGNKYQMIVSWPMLVPTEFTALLKERSPLVLVILAYYAWLLYYGREMWQVRDAGVYFFRLLDDYLGREWEEWLEEPRKVMIGG